MAEETQRPSIIHDYFDHATLKKLYYNAWRSDIPDLNMKADIVGEIIGDQFQELGCGTNRIVFLRNGIVFKIAFDAPGLADNLTELKRCGERKSFPHVYECNFLIVAQEYWTYMDEDTFMENEAGILEVLSDLAEDYIFDDIGFQRKNYTNWGIREYINADGQMDGEIGVLDFGYVYPKKNQEAALTCPLCGSEIRYNRTYTGFVCSSPSCRQEFEPDEVISRMDLTLDNLETERYVNVTNIPEPIIKHTKMKG